MKVIVNAPEVRPVIIRSGAVGPQGEEGPQGPAGADGAPGADGADGADGVGVPVGGEAGQALVKISGTDYDTEWDYVHTLYITVRNVNGSTLPKGTPVIATGVTGQVPDVIAAIASINSRMPATYVLNEEIADNAQGIAIISGVIEGVDTSSFSPGDVVYVADGGGFTNVKPTGTSLIQNLGVVTRSNANTGSGVVYGAGRSNDVPNLPLGKFFIGSAGNTQESDYTLPTSDGSDGDSLVTDGNGTVSFVNTSTLQVTGITVNTGQWSLSGGIYQATIANGNITSDSIVDVIPSNSDYAVVNAAELLPETSSAASTVKIYAVNLPTGSINFTLNISRSQ